MPCGRQLRFQRVCFSGFLGSGNDTSGHGMTVSRSLIGHSAGHVSCRQGWKQTLTR